MRFPLHFTDDGLPARREPSAGSRGPLDADRQDAIASWVDAHELGSLLGSPTAADLTRLATRGLAP